jgi:glycine/D-amino acid oxidase-like deaminating enzyme
MQNPDAIVIGAGIVGASCALSLTNAGLRVLVIDRGAVSSGTTGAGEGNILVSDKDPGPELTLAIRSRDLWFEMQEDVGDHFELEAKGGVVVARNDDSELLKLANAQRQHGVDARVVGSTDLHELEPFLHPQFHSGVFYPQDAQCQPMLAAAHVIRTLIARGGRFVSQAKVSQILVKGSSAYGVQTSQGKYLAPIIVNAAGTWAGEVARMAGSDLPIAPRRGFILVTEPAPKYIFHKVYDSDYVANVASSEADLQTSTVVEGTRSGTILIGASRERVGFDGSINYDILRTLAAQATSLFPILKDVQLLRAYRGFRPYAPDHLPVVGEDAKIKGLWHSAGHEGAGIGLAPGSAGRPSFMDPSAFSPKRFELAKV